MTCRIAYHREGPRPRGAERLRHRSDRAEPDLARWRLISDRIRNPEGEVVIAVVGKYTGLLDAYKSLGEALSHGGIANKVKVKLEWIESEIFEKQDPSPHLEGVNGILVPGGFGKRGAEGKIRAATFARTREVPYFGICFGMQMACIEAARNLAGIAEASTTEFGPTEEPVVGLMTEWMKGNELEMRRKGGDFGGTMRLGAYEAMLAKDSKIADIYGTDRISERHRHRYEVNMKYRNRLEAAGLQVCRPVAGRTAAGNRRNSRSSVVHRRAVSPRAQIAAVRAAPAVRLLHRRCGRSEPARVIGNPVDGRREAAPNAGIRSRSRAVAASRRAPCRLRGHPDAGRS